MSIPVGPEWGFAAFALIAFSKTLWGLYGPGRSLPSLPMTKRKQRALIAAQRLAWAREVQDWWRVVTNNPSEGNKHRHTCRVPYAYNGGSFMVPKQHNDGCTAGHGDWFVIHNKRSLCKCGHCDRIRTFHDLLITEHGREGALFHIGVLRDAQAKTERILENFYGLTR